MFLYLNQSSKFFNYGVRVYGLPSIITSNIETLENDVYSQKVETNQKKLLKNLKK